MHEVFISFSSRDVKIAEAAKHLLEARGIRCWKAPESIVPGQVWEEAIADAISASSCMLLIWSSESQNSRQVRRELTLAASREKIIVPFRIEEIEPSGVFAYYLANTHWMDAINSDIHDGLERLAMQIKKLLGALPTHPLEAGKISSLTPIAAKTEQEDGLDSATEKLETDPSHKSFSEESEVITSSYQKATDVQSICNETDTRARTHYAPHRQILGKSWPKEQTSKFLNGDQKPIFAKGIFPALILLASAVSLAVVIGFSQNRVGASRNGLSCGGIAKKLASLPADASEFRNLIMDNKSKCMNDDSFLSQYYRERAKTAFDCTPRADGSCHYMK